MRGDGLQVATLIDVEGIAEVERERRLVILHIECEGTLPGMDAVCVQGDSLARSAVGRTFDNADEHFTGKLHRLDAVVVIQTAVFSHLIDARLAAIDTCHHLVGDVFLGVSLDEEIQELRSLWRCELCRHSGEEVVPQKLLDVAGEVLFEIKHLERSEDLLRSVRDGSQLELIERDVAVAQVIFDYRAQVVYLHAASVWEMQCRENGVVSTIETHLDFVVITRGDHDVGNLRGKHQAPQFCL